MDKLIRLFYTSIIFISPLMNLFNVLCHTETPYHYFKLFKVKKLLSSRNLKSFCNKIKCKTGFDISISGTWQGRQTEKAIINFILSGN